MRVKSSFKTSVIEALASPEAQPVVAKATIAMGSGTLILGLKVSEAAALIGALVAVIGLCFQIWLGMRRLRLERISTRIKAMQADVQHISERLDESELPTLSDFDDPK